MKKLILASASPRRRDLLQKEGLLFDVHPADIDETPHIGESPHDYVGRMAYEKANAIAINQPANEIILAADTIVVFNNKILGKPCDKTEAFSFIKKLSGHTHTVLTATCIIKAPQTVIDQQITESFVTIEKLLDDQINAYIETGEPMDKAGAYAAQGVFKKHIVKIDGLLSNVIGLPIENLLPVLTKIL